MNCLIENDLLFSELKDVEVVFGNIGNSDIANRFLADGIKEENLNSHAAALGGAWLAWLNLLREEKGEEYKWIEED